MANRRLSAAFKNSLYGSVLGGALGDALGAPIEVIRNFDELTNSYGESGLDHMIPYVLSWGDTTSHGTGVITDDTTMLATTLAAINVGLQETATKERLLALMRDGYLRWGELQQGGEPLKALQDHSIQWPDNVHPFWFVCGAGRGTIAALQQPVMGTIENPVTYDVEIRGKRMIGPNKGCGGMMRVAPIAFLPISDDEVFELACRNAAITHGAPEAYLASGCVAMMVRHMMNGHSGPRAVRMMRDYLHEHYEQTAPKCIYALNTALSASLELPSTKVINRLPKIMGFKNAFLAVPVLAQVAYSLLISARMPGSPSDKFRRTLAIAVTHSGDSDSVGAIVGNCLGALLGEEGLPKDWLHDVGAINDLRALVQSHIELRKAPSPASPRGMQPA